MVQEEPILDQKIENKVDKAFHCHKSNVFAHKVPPEGVQWVVFTWKQRRGLDWDSTSFSECKKKKFLMLDKQCQQCFLFFFSFFFLQTEQSAFIKLSQTPDMIWPVTMSGLFETQMFAIWSFNTWEDAVLTKPGINICNCLIHGHVYQSSPQAEVREHQQQFLQPLIEHQQRLATRRHKHIHFTSHCHEQSTHKWLSVYCETFLGLTVSLFYLVSHIISDDKIFCTSLYLGMNIFILAKKWLHWNSYRLYKFTHHVWAL